MAEGPDRIQGNVAHGQKRPALRRMAVRTPINVSYGMPRTARSRRTVKVRATENRTPKHIGQYY
jgi:hypothetical protein